MMSDSKYSSRYSATLIVQNRIVSYIRSSPHLEELVADLHETANIFRLE